MRLRYSSVRRSHRRTRLWTCLFAGLCVIALAAGSGATAAGGSSWWKVDTHEHSAFSGDAKADIWIDAQLAQQYGYNAVFLTDHDRGTGFQINGANGNYQAFTDPKTWKTTATTVGDSTWTGKPTPNQPVAGASIPALDQTIFHGASGSSIHLKTVGSATKTISSMIYTDRGPALNAGNVTLAFWLYPNQLTATGAGADVSVSLGGDVATGPKPFGYTTANGPQGLGAPKSTVLVWQVGTARKPSQNATTNTDVFVNQLHAPTLHTWNYYTVNVTTGALTWTDGIGSASPPPPTVTGSSLDLLPAADKPDTRMVVLTYDKMEAVATAAGGVADVYFDDYVAEDSTPNCPAQEFVDRNKLIDSGMFNTSTFAMYPAREMGQTYHANQFIFDIQNAADYNDPADDSKTIPGLYGNDAALCTTNAGASAPWQFENHGTDNITNVQHAGQLAQLNHPGVTESVAAAIAGNDHGADFVEVQTDADYSSPWDQVLATGHQVIGTYGSDAHRGVGPTAPSDFIYAPSFQRADLLAALNQGFNFMARGTFTGHTGAFNLDNSNVPYPARNPVMVAPGTTTTVYLNIDGGLPSGSTVKWFSSSGTLDANLLAPQLGAPDPAAADGSYHGSREVTLTGTFTYVRAAVYDSAGNLYANTEPIFFRPNSGGGGGGGGGSLSFTPSADAYVVAGSTTKYGTSTKLKVDSDPATTSYLRFTLNGITGTVSNVQLQIYATSALKAGFFVNSLNDDSWGEKTINGTNAPKIGAQLASSGPVVTGSYVTITLPNSVVTGNNDLNLALTPNSATALALSSREDPTNPPHLLVTIS